MRMCAIGLFSVALAGCGGQVEPPSFHSPAPSNNTKWMEAMSSTDKPQVILLKPNAETQCKAGESLDVEADVRLPAESTWIPENIIIRIQHGQVVWAEHGEQINPKKEKRPFVFSKTIPLPSKKAKVSLRIVVNGIDTSRPLPGAPPSPPTGEPLNYESEPITLNIR